MRVVFEGEVYTAAVPAWTISVYSAALCGDELVLQGLWHQREELLITINRSTGEVVVKAEEDEGDYFAYL